MLILRTRTINYNKTAQLWFNLHPAVLQYPSRFLSNPVNHLVWLPAVSLSVAQVSCLVDVVNEEATYKEGDKHVLFRVI